MPKLPRKSSSSKSSADPEQNLNCIYCIIRSSPSFKGIDANGDGYIDYNEMDRRFRSHMTKEHVEQEKQEMEAMEHEFKVADADGSLGVTVAEWAKHNKMGEAEMVRSDTDP